MQLVAAIQTATSSTYKQMYGIYVDGMRMDGIMTRKRSTTNTAGKTSAKKTQPDDMDLLEGAKIAQYIGFECEALRKIAVLHDLNFLAYILKMAVLETKIVLGEHDLT